MIRMNWLHPFKSKSTSPNSSRSKRSKRRPLVSKLAAAPQVEVFESRVLMTIDSPLDQSFPTGSQPVDVETGYIDLNVSLDAIVLRTDGQVAVALNDGNNRWVSVTTADLGVSGAVGLAADRLNGDTFHDIANQGEDQIVFGVGDGLGGFAPSGSWMAPTAQ